MDQIRSQARKSIVLAALALMLAAVALTAAGFVWNFPPQKPRHIEVSKVPPPTHVEWDGPFPVGGFLLMNPSVSDSLGRHPVLQLPDGSVLMVPRLVEGEDPDTTSRKKS